MAVINRESDAKTNEINQNPANQDDNLGQTVEKFSHRIGNRIGSFVGNVTNKTHTYMDSTQNYVEEHPIKSLAIAAGTGMVVGSLITLVLRKRR